MARYDIELILAPSILGLRSTGVEHLAKTVVHAGLAEKLSSSYPIIEVPTLNVLYSKERDPETHCLNSKSIKDFSLILGETVKLSVQRSHFACVLGGDCSILVGIMSGLKSMGTYGLLFLDAHADFYQPEKSITGEVADMDLAIVTGRGPDLLTNLNGCKPYVKEEHVMHIGQRDEEEAKKYGSQDIRETAITCFGWKEIKEKGLDKSLDDLLGHLLLLETDGFWIHFDTDVISDEENPAVDYRLPGGLSFAQVETILRSLLQTGKITGMSITIFNPSLDQEGCIARQLVEMLRDAFKE